jgi:hypothetical protein
MSVHSLLPIMWKANPVGALTEDSIRQAEKGAAEQTRLTDEANAKLRAARSQGQEDTRWHDELDSLEARFASCGTVDGAKQAADQKNSELDQEVQTLQLLHDELRMALKDPDNFHSGRTIEGKLEKVTNRLYGAKRRAEAARAQGKQGVECAKAFEPELPRLFELRKRARKEKEFNRQLRQIK